MNNEVAAGKSKKISLFERVKLAVITLVHHRFGPRLEAHLPVSQLRLVYLLYLADLEWYRDNGETYLGNWIYANNGPYLQDALSAIHDMDGLELEGNARLGFKPGPHNRYRDWQLDHRFEQMLVDVKRQCYFMNVGGIKKIVYASLPMQNACLGDRLFS